MSFEMVSFWLAIAAIILAAIAVIPYIIEVILYFSYQPKFAFEIVDKRIQPAKDNNGSDILFHLWLTLHNGRSCVLKRTLLSFPFNVEPFMHPELDALPSDLKFEAQRFWRPVIAAETGEYGPALILQSGESWLTPKTLIGCQLAFHTKQLTNELRLDIVLRAEIDSARLGLWSIFYHSRGYLLHRAITVNLTSLERQKFA